MRNVLFYCRKIKITVDSTNVLNRLLVAPVPWSGLHPRKHQMYTILGHHGGCILQRPIPVATDSVLIPCSVNTVAGVATPVQGKPLGVIPSHEV